MPLTKGRYAHDLVQHSQFTYSGSGEARVADGVEGVGSGEVGSGRSDRGVRTVEGRADARGGAAAAVDRHGRLPRSDEGPTTTHTAVKTTDDTRSRIFPRYTFYILSTFAPRGCHSPKAGAGARTSLRRDSAPGFAEGLHGSADSVLRGCQWLSTAGACGNAVAGTDFTMPAPRRPQPDVWRANRPRRRRRCSPNARSATGRRRSPEETCIAG